jgi:deoxyribonuclease-4
MLASGIEIRDAASLSKAVRQCRKETGKGRIRSIHLNDSITPLGSNRDRHADIGEGEIGLKGTRVFLSEPAFQKLPCVLETPGPERQGATKEEVALCRKLQKQGLAARRRAKKGD